MKNIKRYFCYVLSRCELRFCDFVHQVFRNPKMFNVFWQNSRRTFCYLFGSRPTRHGYARPQFARVERRDMSHDARNERKNCSRVETFHSKHQQILIFYTNYHLYNCMYTRRLRRQLSQEVRETDGESVRHQSEGDC